MNSEQCDIQAYLPWGHDIAGSNEQALAAAAASAAAQLGEIIYVPFPWNRYQVAQVNKELALRRHLEHQLQALLEKAILSKPRHVITGYAGWDLDWAREQIGRVAAITAVFSCFLTHDFTPPTSQRWIPIALPVAEGHTGLSLAPLQYRYLQQIWKSVQAGYVPKVPYGRLLLPGNAQLWKQLFAEKGTWTAKPLPMAAKAARLIAEEHAGQRCVIQIMRRLKSGDKAPFKLDANNYNLSATDFPRTNRMDRSTRISFNLNMKHSHRTPLAYRQIASRCSKLRQTRLPGSITITGSPGDRSRRAKSLCISEEPLWDLRKCGGLYETGETGYIDGFFDDLPIPYYLAVNPLILDRLRLRLELLAAKTPTMLLEKLWQSHIHYLGIHEFRLGKEKTGEVHPNLYGRGELRGLGQLRTKIGIHARARGLGLSYGKGWGLRGFHDYRRRAFADWHLDKLQLIRTSRPRLGMAMENVHQLSYITEKSFDMLCSGVVPITYAGPNHVLHRYLDCHANLNLYSLTLKEALDAIEHFEPSSATAESMISSASRLAHLLGSKSARNETLARVAERCERWILEQRSWNNYRRNANGNQSSSRLASN